MKKIIYTILVIIVIAAIITGIIFLLNKNQKEDNDTSKALGTNLTNKENEKTKSNDTTKSKGNDVEEDIKEDKDTNSGKILIAYFSRADENYVVGKVSVGNTEILARFIKDYLGDGADSFKIEEVNKYPESYDECTEVAKEEQKNNARPEFKNKEMLDLENYDTIILGYPTWWGDVPMIINTFLESYDFSGKEVYLFNTHEGSYDAGTFKKIKSKLSNSNVNTSGLSIRGKDAREEKSRSDVEDWLKGLGL